MLMQLTKNEFKVLCAVALILFFGSLLQLTFKRYPQLLNMVNLIESNYIYSKIDVNLADAEALERLPYIGPYSAQQIVEFRNVHGRFSSLEELKQIRGIRETNYERFVPYLEVN